MFMARISKYEEWKKNNELESKLLLIEGWSRNGLTQQQIAKNLDINVDTLIEYKKKYTDFSNALKKGKEVVDLEVENALYKKALGYNVRVQKAFKLKDIIYDEKGKKVSETERIEYAEEEVHVPADTTAQIFWLKNRKKKEWRDKIEYETNSDELNKVKDLLNKIEQGAKDE